MNSHFDCKTIREEFLDLAQPGRELSAAGQTHLRECDACAAELAALRQTWSAMDAWQAPEPSVYFDSRLQARLREEQARPARGVLGWLGLRWQPALAAAAAVALAVGISLYRPTTVVAPTQVVAPQGSPAVSDLEKLDKNAEVYNNFDMLYDDEENSSQ